MRKIKIIIFAFLVLGIFFFSSASESASREPVIIVPGITASWNWHIMVGSALPDKWEFFPGIHTYDSLIGALENAGYQKGKDLFVCFYDWRQPISQIAQTYLKDKINLAKEKSGRDKVDIIAHSMGGLVARSYIQAANYPNDVDKLIMMGSPNHGSSDVYTVWEGGVIPKTWGKWYKRGIDIYLWYLAFLKHNTLSEYDTIHRDIPSIGDMMPIYDYIEKELSNGSSTLVSHSQMKVRNPFLENLHLAEGNLLSRVETDNLSGLDYATVDKIKVDPNLATPTRWRDGKPDPFPPPRNDSEGDNRVLKKSAGMLVLGALPGPGNPAPPPSSGFIELGNFREGSFDKTKHTSLPHRSINEVFYWLNRPSPASAPVFPIPHFSLPAGPPSTPVPAPYPEFAKSLNFFFAKNVTPKITAPDGKYIDSTTSTIPFGEYDAAANPLGPKIITIPNPEAGNYKIELKGLKQDNDIHFASYFTSDSQRQMINFVTPIQKNEKRDYLISLNPSQDHPITAKDSFSLDDLMSEVKNDYKEGKIKEPIDCNNFSSTSFRKIGQKYFKDIRNLPMGELDPGETECVKLNVWLETNDNIYQGGAAGYKIISKASQLRE